MSVSAPTPYVVTPDLLEALTAHLARLRMAGRRDATCRERYYAVLRFARQLEVCPLRMTPLDMDSWQAKALSHLSDVTRSNELMHVGVFYKWCIGEGLIPVDLGTAVLARIVRPRLPRRVPRPISEPNLQLALEHAPEQKRPWIVLAGWAGLRAGEIARLHRDDIHDSDPEPTAFIQGKGGRERIVPLSPFVIAELTAAGMPTRGPIFRRVSDGAAHTPCNLSGMANKYLRSVGVHDTFHALRHRFGTQLYRATRDLRLVQEVMGHNDPATTALYVAWARGHASEAVAQIPTPT